MHREDGQITGAAAGSVTLQDAPMRMALQPQETTLAVALGDGGILKFRVTRDVDGVPVLQQLQGRISLALPCHTVCWYRCSGALPMDSVLRGAPDSDSA